MQADALVVFEIGQGGGRAVRAQVARRGAQQARIGGQAPRHQFRIAQGGHPQRQVQALADDVLHPVGQVEVDAQVGMALEQGRQ